MYFMLQGSKSNFEVTPFSVAISIETNEGSLQSTKLFGKLADVSII